MTLRTSPARRRPPRPRRQDGALRRLGHAARYPSGTLAEHRACRTRRRGVRRQPPRHGAGRRAPTRSAGLQAAFTNDLAKVGPGRAQYTHLLDAADASVLDDIIVWWVDDERFDVMPNASNTDRRAWPPSAATDVTADAGRARRAGPRGPGSPGHRRPRGGRRRPLPRASRPWWTACPCVVAGTGYTGEDGVEMAVPGRRGAGLVGRACSPPAWCRPGSAPATRCASRPGCRCTATSSAPGITPLQAGLGWVVAWDKGRFRGREALEAEREPGVRPPAAGPAVAGRRPPRAEQAVLVDGEPVGVVTSGNFSPVLEHGIALAFLPPDVEDGTAVEIDVRGEAVPATVVPTPFVAKQK